MAATARPAPADECSIDDVGQPLQWLAWTTRFVLFTGKGGVGKTTVAATSAVALADHGERVLLVSTDPASNLHDIFGTATGRHVLPAARPVIRVLDLVGRRHPERDETRAAKVLAEFETAIAMAPGETHALAEPGSLARSVESGGAEVSRTYRRARP